ncbi:MAG: hypothetical protein JXQ72_15555 [Anaerolineae bacterium]|nr:hypothetical protein [Anaerolineae bacterium]
MRDTTRMIATLVIWIAMAALIGGLLTTPTGAIANAEGAVLFGIVMVMAIAGVISTGMVWFAGTRGQRLDTVQRSKAKRHTSNRVERLIEALDDDEIYDLEALLLARDQEGSGRQHQP